MATKDAQMDDGKSLPFSPVQQDAILGYLLDPSNITFFLQSKNKIKPEWFLNPWCGKLWKARVMFQDQFGRPPCSPQEFKEFPEISCQDGKSKLSLMQKMGEGEYQMQFFPLQGMMPRLTEWLQSRIYYQAMDKSIVDFNSGRIVDAFRIIKDASKEIDTVKFLDDEEYHISDYKLLAKNVQLDLSGALTFGVDVLDKLLTPEATGGCLLRGDTTVLLAPTNIGKSTTLVTIAAHNLMKKKNILWITHEGTPQDLSLKLWMNILGRTKQEYLATVADPKKLELLEAMARLMREHLVYVPMNKAGMCVEDVDVLVQRKVEEFRARTGENLDLLVDDYPSKLWTKKGDKGNLAKRHVDEIVYNYFVGWATTYKFHSLVAIQANREASKTNRGTSRNAGDSGRLLTPEDVSESFGPCQTATNIITINRDPESQAKNRLTFYLCKSRSSETGVAIVCKSDFSRAMSHSNKLGATWYRGTSTMAGRIDDLFNQYQGTAIPSHLYVD